MQHDWHVKQWRWWRMAQWEEARLRWDEEDAAEQARLRIIRQYTH
jgi:hypothetical protein